MAAALAGIAVEEELDNSELRGFCMQVMDETAKEIMNSDEYIEVARIGLLRSQGNYAEYNDALKTLLDKWKADYTICMK